MILLHALKNICIFQINDHQIEAAFSDDEFDNNNEKNHLDNHHLDNHHDDQMSFPMHEDIENEVEDSSYLQNSIISSPTNDDMHLIDPHSAVISSQSSVGSEYNHKPSSYNNSYYFYQG